MSGTEINLHDHGAQHFKGVALQGLNDLRASLAHLPDQRAGVRIKATDRLRSFLTADGPVGSIARNILGPDSRAVRAVLFDKTPEVNWSLAWHQDRTICVRHRIEVPGFGPWTVKGGMQHVAPPFSVLAKMITLRVHIDDVSMLNAPLVVAPGSHRVGIVRTTAIDRVVRQCGTAACLAEAGDVWVYSTPILHASEAAVSPARRRVLQVDYAAEDLPGGLEWLGV